MARKDNSSTAPKGEVRHLKLLTRYLRPYHWQMVAAVLALIITSSAVLGMGAGLRHLIDDGLSKGDATLLDRAFWWLIAAVVLMTVASYVRFFLGSSIGERAIADIRNDVYRHLIGLHIGFFETTRTGELLSRLTTDTTLLQTIISTSVAIAIRNGILLIGGFTLMLLTSMQLTGYVCLMVPLVVAPIILIGRRVRIMGREAQGRIADMSAQAEETFNGIRAVQSLTLEPYEKERFSGFVDGALQAALRRIRIRAVLTALVIFLVFGAIVTVLWFGGHDVLAGHISAGELSAFVFYSVVVAGSVGAISEVWGDLQRAAGAAERLGELLAVETTISSPIREEAGRGARLEKQNEPVYHLRPHPNPPPVGEGVVSFDHLSFTYPARPDKPAIHDFTLVAEPGTTTALVGPSGAGKTTIFQLLLRFYDPASGHISINGMDIREMPLAKLRGIMGMVPQDPVIFSGTARENIRLGNLQASDEDILRAAQAASALEFLQGLPQGLDTHLGQKGIQLSGGQRQRIAIARAVIRNPKILLLDEATSALDSENEYAIQQALTRLVQGRTTFVIAHRLSTIMQADQIVLMNEGRIEAVGKHLELLEKSPLYARLATLQFTH